MNPDLLVAAGALLGWVHSAWMVIQLRRRLHTDRLTGLSNRDGLAVALRRARRGADSVGLLLLDLDNFKQVNDQHGHRAGDAVLREVATRLAAATQSGELSVRLHGDEFAVLLGAVPSGDTGLQVVATRAAEIGRAVATTVDINEHVVVAVSASVGSAVLAATLADIGELLGRADTAMYRTKPRRSGASAGKDLVIAG